MTAPPLGYAKTDASRRHRARRARWYALCGGFEGVLLRSVEHAVQLAVDGGVHRHPAVARVHLRLLGVRGQARPPVDDRVAARVDGERLDAGGERRGELLVEALAALAVTACAREQPRQTEVAETRE